MRKPPVAAARVTTTTGGYGKFTETDAVVPQNTQNAFRIRPNIITKLSRKGSGRTSQVLNTNGAGRGGE